MNPSYLSGASFFRAALWVDFRRLEDPEIADFSNAWGPLCNEPSNVFGKQSPGHVGRDIPDELRRHMDDESVGRRGETVFVTDLIVHGMSFKCMRFVVRGELAPQMESTANLA
jgi:hypothetical protein